MKCTRSLPQNGEDSESDVRQQFEHRLHLVRLNLEVKNHFGALQENIANIVTEQCQSCSNVTSVCGEDSVKVNCLLIGQVKRFKSAIV